MHTAVRISPAKVLYFSDFSSKSSELHSSFVILISAFTCLSVNKESCKNKNLLTADCSMISPTPRIYTVFVSSAFQPPSLKTRPLVGPVQSQFYKWVASSSGLKSDVRPKNTDP